MIEWIPYTNRAAWHETRRQGIGGSDVAAILGLSKYTSPHGVWASKVGILPPRDGDTMNQIAGHVLEPMIAARLQGMGWKLAKYNGTAVDNAHAWRRANIDRSRVEPRGIVEIKTASPFVRPHWSHGVPDYYAVQCQYYMGILDMPVCWVAVWFLGDAEIEIVEIERDDAGIAEIFEAVDAFWHEHVVPVEPPTLTGHAEDLGVLSQRLAEQRASEVAELDAEGATLIAEYVQAKQRAEQATRAMDECKAAAGAMLEASEVKRFKGDAGSFGVMTNARIDKSKLRELATAADSGVAWADYMTEFLDLKALAKDFPELAKTAKVPAPYVRFWPK